MNIGGICFHEDSCEQEYTSAYVEPMLVLLRMLADDEKNILRRLIKRNSKSAGGSIWSRRFFLTHQRMTQARAGDKHGRMGVTSFGGRVHARFIFPSKANRQIPDDQSLIVRGERPPSQHLPPTLTRPLRIQAAQKIVQFPGERLREH